MQSAEKVSHHKVSQEPLQICGKVQTLRNDSNEWKPRVWRNREDIKFWNCLL